MTLNNPHPDLASALVREFSAEMARRGVKAATIAGIAGMTPSTLSRKLNEQVSVTIPDADAIARALGTPLSDFLRRAEWTIDGGEVAS